MLRVLLASLTAAVAAGVVAATAQAQPAYHLVGVEIQENPATFVGTITGGGRWLAVVHYAGALQKSPGATTPLTGGLFAIRPAGSQPLTGAITGGAVTAGAVRPLLVLGWCVQHFRVAGTIASPAGPGTFSGALTHYGVLRGPGDCDAVAATVELSVTFG